MKFAESFFQQRAQFLDGLFQLRDVIIRLDEFVTGKYAIHTLTICTNFYMENVTSSSGTT